jgi:glyoxylase-like metal-dependent hydrolase (beta-lactamase superfamily II)
MPRWLFLWSGRRSFILERVKKSSNGVRRIRDHDSSHQLRNAGGSVVSDGGVPLLAAARWRAVGAGRYWHWPGGCSQFHESDTAVRRIEALGLDPEKVRHIVLTHGDPDHAGGLADFPNALVHIAQEELVRIESGHWRYVPAQFAHGPVWKAYGPAPRRWSGLEARPVDLGFSAEVLLVPLFGHTLGHCGVAVQQEGRWLLHVGDAYYLRAELTTDDHPVSAIACQRADDDAQRRESLERLRDLVRHHGEEVDLVGYHDLAELPAGYPLP